MAVRAVKPARVEPVRVEPVRVEDLRYGGVDVLQHAVRANHFTIVETWRDERAHEAHRAAAHTRQFREQCSR